MRMHRLAFGVLVLAWCAGTAPASAAEGEVKLRNWYAGIQTVRGERDSYDVFAREGLPPGPVETIAPGGGLAFGRRFGDRFLFGFQFVMTGHEIEGYDGELYVGEALLAGTVLFNERGVVQPFARGAFGGGMTLVRRAAEDDAIVALGTAVVLGGGLQLRASSRVSFELEAAGTAANYYEVDHDATGDDWSVRTSHLGWRIGIGFYLWF